MESQSYRDGTPPRGLRALAALGPLAVAVIVCARSLFIHEWLLLLPGAITGGYWIVLLLSVLFWRPRFFFLCVGASLLAMLASAWLLSVNVHVEAEYSGSPWWWYPYLVNAAVVLVTAPAVALMCVVQRVRGRRSERVRISRRRERPDRRHVNTEIAGM